MVTRRAAAAFAETHGSRPRLRVGASSERDARVPPGRKSADTYLLHEASTRPADTNTALRLPKGRISDSSFHSEKALVAGQYR